MLSLFWYLLNLGVHLIVINKTCPSGGIIFSTQSQVDSFNILYSGCTIIPGDVEIYGGQSINNLDSLYLITDIQGTLDISNCDSLRNIEGLRSLRMLNGGLLVANNPLIKNLKGLDSLHSINGDLYLNNNASLVNIDGLTSIKPDGITYLSIFNCTQLNDCNISSICSYIIDNLQNDASIYDNGPGCSSAPQIQKSCNPAANPCPIDGLTFTTQSQVDSFNIHYPGCTRIPEYAVISGPAIKNLDSLYKITDIDGSFEISDCDSLIDVHGLSGLKHINGSLDIVHNALIKNLLGLDSLVSVNGPISFYNNPALESLNGIGSLDPKGVNYLRIAINPNLSVCTNLFICNYLVYGGGYQINNNASGCSSWIQLQKACNPNALCPSGELSFRSKTDIEEFKVLYPGCHDIDGSVYLEFFPDFDSTTLLPFIHIWTIKNHLSLYINNGMKNLHGFDSLTKVGGNLFIQGNQDLTDISGLERLKKVGGLYLAENPILSDIHAVDALSPDSCNYLYIVDCPVLSTCNTPFVCGFSKNKGPIISGNGQGCATTLQILKACYPDLECPPESVTFNSQPELNEFKKFYPNCTHINGSLQIYSSNDSSVTSLSPLNRIKYIAIGLLVIGNDELIDFTGLDSLTEIGKNIYIEANESLQSLNGLDALKTIHSTLYISRNDALTDIQSLKSLDPNLISTVQIINNPYLSYCGIESICQYLSLGKLAFVYGNDTTCASLNELKKQCGVSACLGSGISFSTQEQINHFPQDYPGCNIIGSLNISGTDITNLDSLQQIKNVNGDLSIYNNTVLRDVSGLKNVAQIKGSFSIESNPVLENVSGLYALTDVFGGLYLYECPALRNIEGLESLVSPNHISDLIIEYCTSLSVCSIFPICEYLNNPDHSAVIDNNAVGCNTRAQIRTSCGDALCPIGSVTLSSQSDVDSFNIIYFDCSSVPGDLTITGSGITSLDSLRNITSVSGVLRIEGTSLISLHGLENLDHNQLFGLELQNNSLLKVCELKPICDYLSIPSNPYLIDHNAASCNSYEAIQSECAKTCFYEGLTLTTQSEVDQFPINYSTCQNIPGFLIIQGSDIINLDSLSHLRSVGGTLLIDGTSLVNLKGLNALTTIGGSLSIRNNSLLTSIEDLNVSDSLNGQLNITNNSALTNLIGLEQLSQINFQVTIRDNPNLLDLGGLNGIKNIIGTFTIQNNGSLTDLTGLENLIAIGANFTIQSNSKLKTFHGLSVLTTVTGTFRIQSNVELDSISGLPVIQFVGRDLIIQNNDVLENLNGFSSLTYLIRTLNINNNPSLTDISGLINFTPGLVTNLIIQNNPLLDECHILSICNYFYIDGKTSTINGNDTNCLSKNAILDACTNTPLENEYVLKPQLNKSISNQKDVPIEKDKYYLQVHLRGPDQTITTASKKKIQLQNSKPVIFPNPATHEISISIQGNAERMQVEIKNMIGRSVKNTFYSKDQKIDIRNLAPGMYTIIIFR